MATGKGPSEDEAKRHRKGESLLHCGSVCWGGEKGGAAGQKMTVTIGLGNMYREGKTGKDSTARHGWFRLSA